MHLGAYFVTSFYSGYLFAHTFDDAAELVSKSYRRFNAPLRPAVPSIYMPVRAANRGRRYAYQEVGGANVGHRRGFKLQSRPSLHFAQGIHLPRLSHGHLSRLLRTT